MTVYLHASFAHDIAFMVSRQESKLSRSDAKGAMVL
jgi:hypothetical protein